MGKFKKIIGVLLVCSLSYVGMLQCFGNFALTVKVHAFVKGLGNKWVGWIVFLVFLFIPVWGIAMLVDVIIFNSIEFWTGKSALSKADFDEKGEHQKVVVKGNEKAVFTYKKYGEEIEIGLYKNNQHVKTMVLKKSEPGVFYIKNGDKLEPLDMQIEDRNNFKLVTIRQGDKVLVRKSMSISRYAELTKRSTYYEKRHYAQNPTLGGAY